jgi:hypothetical protein
MFVRANSNVDWRLVSTPTSIGYFDFLGRLIGPLICQETLSKDVTKDVTSEGDEPRLTRKLMRAMIPWIIIKFYPGWQARGCHADVRRCQCDARSSSMSQYGSSVLRKKNSCC